MNSNKFMKETKYHNIESHATNGWIEFEAEAHAAQ
jgi:hypothetical protein